ncbi:hypothetical protein AMATHDRAFT_66251 [Amanita thiersii Skay4041]|uniref:Protein kinase domain-containing protein n=1 Tax=Amanita thiersii Skay4041 TaxID=703135 RepID=A0A2A9NK04_9AGAR|nr:hypothetical protein AMATHDRAFT_66251 [Amanita thiersii Skay4041]
MTLYATAHQASQFRLHVFQVLVFQTYARFLRWDRAGVVVSEKVTFSNSAIAELYWRYTLTDDTSRGQDTTVEELSQGDPIGEEARRALQVEDDAILYKISLGTKGKTYIIARGLYMVIGSPIGRSTRGFSVFCLETKKVGYLKDTWRILSKSLKPEHEIYQKLYHPGVNRIPQIDAASDMLDHSTKTHEVSNRPWVKMDSRKRQEFQIYIHYRIVFETVGYSLLSFRDVKEYVTAIRDAVEAHRDAYHLAKVLHGDISVDNILIDENGRGLLIDWDLSKDLDLQLDTQPSNYGTWRFKAFRLIKELREGEEETVSDYVDDLESFFYVLYWVALRYTKHGLTRQSLNEELYLLYDDYFLDHKGVPRSTACKRAHLTS